MESLSGEVWDVVIAGTSLPQALLALALSRSGKKVLHVDRNRYYGGEDAGLSLDDAQAWAEDVQKEGSTIFSDATITTAARESQRVDDANLASSRSYTLSLNPQIIYAQSAFLPSLVSSQIHNQLEFLAVGSWWIFDEKGLQKIPSTREDVFNDENLSVKDKRGLMKFLRFVLQEEQDQQETRHDPEQTLRDALQDQFHIPTSLQSPILALALSNQALRLTPFSEAVARVRRHLRSIGYFGPGFGAVIAKYGGNAEAAQVACRAGAVGGGTYLLGHGITKVAFSNPKGSESSQKGQEDFEKLVEVTLSSEVTVKTHFLVGGEDDIPELATTDMATSQAFDSSTIICIAIVSADLKHLFPQTAENGPTPAVAIGLVRDQNQNDNESPTYLQIHSEDTGECPSGQYIVYASTEYTDDQSRAKLNTAIQKLLESSDAEKSATILWSLSFIKRESKLSTEDSLVQESSQGVFTFMPRKHDIAFDDDALDAVRTVWNRIIGSDATDQNFLRFEEREDRDEVVNQY